MLASLSPVGEAGRGRRWPVSAGSYVLGSIAGGAAIGALLGAAGRGVLAIVRADVSAPWLPLLLAALALGGIAADLGLLGLTVPSWRRQVDERWLMTYREWVYGGGFGAQLGSGVVTRVAASITYVALATAALSASWRAGLAIGAAFGATRGLPLLLTARTRDVAALHSLHRRLARLAAPVARVALGGQAAVGVAVAVTWAGRPA